MIHYILQVIAFQLLFLVVYDVFLKKETFFTSNRIYLLGTAVLSFVVPFLKFEAIQQTIPQQFRVQLPKVILGNATASLSPDSVIVLNEIVLQQDSFSWSQVLLWLYISGVLVAVMLFVFKLLKLYSIKRMATITKFKTYSLASVPKSSVAFTFLKTIYLGAAISEEKKHHILQHELVHVKQNHTLDLLFFEGLRILLWFNPLVYLFQKKLQALHEYTADRIVATTNKTGYYQNLLSEVFGTTKISFINTFYKSSIIKNRIIMLQKSNSKKIVQLKYLLLIPAVCAMLFYTSCSEDTSTNNADLVSQIENLSAEISSKEELTQEEKDALAAFVHSNYPNGEGAIKNENGTIHLNENRKQFKTAGVPFGNLDQAPIFPGCDVQATQTEIKKCFTQKVATFIIDNFPKEDLEEVGVSGRNRIVVEFVIDQHGYIADLKIRTNNPYLESATQHVFTKFPAVTPAVHEGKDVAVFYTLPIIYEMDE